MRIWRIVFELWTKIVSGGQKNCAYLKNTSLTDYEKALISAKLAFSGNNKRYFEMTVCSTPTNQAIVVLLS